MASVYDIIEKARKTGKVEKGTNEVTKAIERGTAKLVAYGGDVEPKEIIQHLPILCKEKNIPCVEADKKEKLGISVGLNISTAAACVIDLGEAEKDFEGFLKGLK
jgi:large subunit ribosomal protein L7Ae